MLDIDYEFLSVLLIRYTYTQAYGARVWSVWCALVCIAHRLWPVSHRLLKGSQKDQSVRSLVVDWNQPSGNCIAEEKTNMKRDDTAKFYGRRQRGTTAALPK